MIAMAMMTVSTLVVLALGVLHLVYTFSGPKLTPRDPALRARMDEVNLVITRQTTVWRAWIGFNASHSLGAILFGLVYGFLANAYPELLFNSPFLLIVGFAMLGGLAVLAKLYWFRIPFTGVVVSLVCYVLSIIAWHGPWIAVAAAQAPGPEIRLQCNRAHVRRVLSSRPANLRSTSMSYIDGFVIAVPKSNKQKFIEHANKGDSVFAELGATRILECWNDDVPDGEVTDFRRAVQAKDDEAVVFSWIEWPDKATRDAAMGRMEELMKTDPRMNQETNPMPFDAKRMIYGGFAPVVTLEK